MCMFINQFPRPVASLYLPRLPPPRVVPLSLAFGTWGNVRPVLTQTAPVAALAFAAPVAAPVAAQASAVAAPGPAVAALAVAAPSVAAHILQF